MPEMTIEGELRDIPYVLSPITTLPSSVRIHLSDGTTMNGESLTEFSRGELRELAESNRIDTIDFDAIPFIANYPNKNFIRFRDGDLSTFFGSFAGQPFLRDHRQWAISAREGTITQSGRVAENGVAAMQQTISITNKDGILSFINGQMDRFSIGWDAKKITCSICNSNWFKCSHWPGRTYEIDEQDTICELIFEKPKGVESSAVNRPAVDGTKILAQLSANKQSYLKKMEAETMPNENEEELVENAETPVNLSEQVATIAAANEETEENEDPTVGDMTVGELANALGLIEFSETIAFIANQLEELRSELPGNDFLEGILQRVANTEQAIVTLSGQGVSTQTVSNRPTRYPHLEALERVASQTDRSSMVGEPENVASIPKPNSVPETTSTTSKQTLKPVDHSGRNKQIASRQLKMWNNMNGGQ